MMKKVSLVIFLLTVLFIVSYFVPSNKFTLYKFLGIEEQTGYSALEVYSLGGDMKVIMDGVEQGIVRESSGNFKLTPVVPGPHTVRLERISSTTDFYLPFEQNIDFAEGFTVIVSWESGPSQALSSGWVLSAEKYNDTNKGMTQITVTTDTNDLYVNLGETVLDLPVVDRSLSLTNPMSVKVSGENYYPITFDLFPEEDTERFKLANYKLNLYVNLFLIPVQNAT